MGQVKQKILGTNSLVIFIALLSAFVPLSTDLYLPALPGMSAYFGTSAGRINLTLTAFFIFYALGTLVWGPLSDHFGRKPVLVVGMGLYVIASVSCALMWSVDGLVLCRIFQAIGGSAAGTVATAIVKDVYSGKKRESSFSYCAIYGAYCASRCTCARCFFNEYHVMAWYILDLDWYRRCGFGG